MIKPPQVNGLVLCDRVRVEKEPPSFNLEGIFLTREFTVFPTPIVTFDVYASFFDGRGEGLLRLLCTQLEGERDIYYYDTWWVFSRHVQTMHLVRSVKKLFFTEPGRYSFTLAFDNIPLTVRYLDVKEVH